MGQNHAFLSALVYTFLSRISPYFGKPIGKPVDPPRVPSYSSGGMVVVGLGAYCLSRLIIADATIIIARIKITIMTFIRQATIPELLSIVATLIALLALLVSILLYVLNKRTFSLLYSKPVARIGEIKLVARVEKDGMGGYSQINTIRIRVYNPSSIGNYYSYHLAGSRFGKALKEGLIYDCNETDELKPFGKSGILIYADDSFKARFEGKRLWLIIKDIRGKKHRLSFRFFNTGPHD
ncbi:MAG: hypothetical protein ABFD52_06830 [Acidobacteriota bacterium]